MRSQLKQIGGLIAVLVLGSTLVQAQETGLGGGLKLRAGYGLTQASDNLDRRTLGFGFEMNYTHSWGRVGVELGYLYKPGNQYNSDVTTFPLAPEAAPIVPADSTDSRKNSLAGLTLRLSYEKNLPSSDYFLRAGLEFGSLKYRQEYIGDVTDDNAYEDTYNGSVNKTKISVSPYVGIGYNINPTSALELNLVLQGYQAANYVHVAGSVSGSYGGGNTAMDYVTTSSHSMAHLEIGYTFRF